MDKIKNYSTKFKNTKEDIIKNMSLKPELLT